MYRQGYQSFTLTVPPSINLIKENFEENDGLKIDLVEEKGFVTSFSNCSGYQSRSFAIAKYQTSSLQNSKVVYPILFKSFSLLCLISK